MILFEFTLEDLNSKYLKVLDKRKGLYIDKNGEYIRHAKYIFKSDNLQNKLVKEWKYHDPSKDQDGCIQVLLGKIKSKWYPLVTLRKLSAKCIKKYPNTYKKISSNIYKKALNYSTEFNEREKRDILRIVSRFSNKTKVSNPKIIENSKIFTS